jgi:hypothetical protein
MECLPQTTNRGLAVGKICGFLMFCDGASFSCSGFQS